MICGPKIDVGIHVYVEQKVQQRNVGGNCRYISPTNSSIRDQKIQLWLNGLGIE